MKKLESIKEDCGFYIDCTNLEVTTKEVDFLCRSLAQDILNELASYVDRNLPASSYVNALKLYLGMK